MYNVLFVAKNNSRQNLLHYINSHSFIETPKLNNFVKQFSSLTKPIFQISILLCNNEEEVIVLEVFMDFNNVGVGLRSYAFKKFTNRDRISYSLSIISSSLFSIDFFIFLIALIWPVLRSFAFVTSPKDPIHLN